MKIKIVKIHQNAVLPTYGTAHSAGCDIYSCLETPITIPPLGRVLISTGIIVEIPPGFYGQIVPRSGLAIKHGITLINSPGIVDADYRGEWRCILANLSDKEFLVEHGMRIAQLIIQKYEPIEWLESESLEESSRGSGGFGSTGIF